MNPRPEMRAIGLERCQSFALAEKAHGIARKAPSAVPLLGLDRQPFFRVAIGRERVGRCVEWEALGSGAALAAPAHLIAVAIAEDPAGAPGFCHTVSRMIDFKHPI